MSILRRRGEVPDVLADGRLVAVQILSPLARAQAARDAEATVRWLESVSALGPDALAAVDLAACARFLAEAAGVPAGLLRALAEGESAVGGEALANDLQAPALQMSPELRRRLDELEELDARAMVSGSGPTIVALPRTSGYDDGAESSRVLAAQLRERGLCAVACTIG